MDWPRIYSAILTASGQLSEDERLERTRLLMEASYAEAQSVEDLARYACLSREHFIRAFRKAYGSTPHKYLVQQRIQQARRLLERTDLPVTDICLEVGFTSLGSFSTLFRRHVGRSPDHYRRRHVASLGLEPPSAEPMVPTCMAMHFGNSSLLKKRGLVLPGYAPHP